MEIKNIKRTNKSIVYGKNARYLCYGGERRTIYTGTLNGETVEFVKYYGSNILLENFKAMKCSYEINYKRNGEWARF